MRRCVVTLTFLLLMAAPAQADELTGRLLVSLEDRGATARAAAPAVLARAAARQAGRTVPEIGLVTVRPATAAVARRLRADPAVRAVAVERRARPRLVPDDPALADPETARGTPPGTPVQWWAARTRLFEAWDLARGESAVVGVIDSGADGGHPELATRIREALDFDSTAGAGPALTDELGHGTHVASLACGAAGNGIGIAGAGYGCGLLIAKTDFSDGSVAEAIVSAADRGVDALNMSFGTDGDHPAAQPIVDALTYAASRGVVLVAAAADANTEEQGDPANVLQPTGTGSDITRNLGLSVTAATFSDQRAPFAGRGSQISIAAYGAFERGSGPPGIFGAFPAGESAIERGSIGPPPQPPCRCRSSSRGDTRYGYLQGTSMAAPIVSGVAALVRGLNPDLPAADVVRLLKETARRPSGEWTPELGWGILDARAALDRARTTDRTAPRSRLRAPTRTRRRMLTLRWSGTDTGPPSVSVSGVAAYEVWRSVGNRRPVRIMKTRRTTRSIRVTPRRRYRFYTVAIDRAGNREAAPTRADASVRVLR